MAYSVSKNGLRKVDVRRERPGHAEKQTGKRLAVSIKQARMSWVRGPRAMHEVEKDVSVDDTEGTNERRKKCNRYARGNATSRLGATGDFASEEKADVASYEKQRAVDDAKGIHRPASHV